MGLYLIEILHQTTTQMLPVIWHIGCILLKFYIKPQHTQCHFVILRVVSYWNSTSNHNSSFAPLSASNVVSYWNSTSNHNSCLCINGETAVVSYWNSTSNHNSTFAPLSASNVVSYWNSTSNHNSSFAPLSASKLYLIEILHQTTTLIRLIAALLSCILLKFYIKPQLVSLH